MLSEVSWNVIPLVSPSIATTEALSRSPVAVVVTAAFGLVVNECAPLRDAPAVTIESVKNELSGPLAKISRSPLPVGGASGVLPDGDAASEQLRADTADAEAESGRPRYVGASCPRPSAS